MYNLALPIWKPYNLGIFMLDTYPKEMLTRVQEYSL